jgi:cob(I)alamin adenosyltransferase
MKTYLSFTDKSEAKMAIHSVDAFDLIDEINSKIRHHFKYGEDNNHEKCLEDIQEIIFDSRLLDLYS